VPTLVFEDVGLYFSRSGGKSILFPGTSKKRLFWALRHVSFTLFEGETLGVIGRNGSGKSTMSMLCARVLVPDEGTVTLNGRTQLLALGVGFKNELSGRENIFISGTLLGLSRNEIRAKMKEIEDFAELGDFIDDPVRTYSSGMKSRLGFAVATAVKPDILILDEVMATGDKAFQDKAISRMKNLRELARSVVMVSHNPAQLRRVATRVLWLEKGRMIMLGDSSKVLNAYGDFCKSPEQWIKNNRGLFEENASSMIQKD
jgi:ABC-type polysaccharide/polyol phosphate transport system ATPase subunit